MSLSLECLCLNTYEALFVDPQLFLRGGITVAQEIPNVMEESVKTKALSVVRSDIILKFLCIAGFSFVDLPLWVIVHV